MSSTPDLVKLLGTDKANAEKIGPLLEDAASALAEVTVPGEAEIHDVVAGAYRFEAAQHDSDDTERRLREAFKNVSKWRDSSQVYLNGAAILLRRAVPSLSRYEAKKRVLAALRALHPTKASERFYFTREKGVDAEPPRTLPVPPATGKAALDHPAVRELVGKSPESLTDEQLALAVALLAVAGDAKAKTPPELLALLGRAGDRAVPRVLEALAKPEDVAKSTGGEASELAIAVRRLIPNLPPVACERILRAALEAGWCEWLDRPLLEVPLDPKLRQRLLEEFGTRQQPRGNPYRPSELFFYNVDPA